jgi:hypothetical protein
MADEGELPPLPMRSLRPLVVITLACFVAVAVVGLGVAIGRLEAEVSPRGPPPPQTFDVAQLLRLDADHLEALRGQTVIIRGVIRERRRDSFGNGYVELGRGLGYEVPIVQCFLADERAATLPAGATSFFRGRVLGMSLAVALQVDACAPEGAN